jgi:hypothetical protein
MLSTGRLARTLASCVACVSVLLSLAAAARGAEGPATVTVRVEGLTSTLLPATTVTTNTTPVVKDGNPADSCSGTSAGGALQLATAGNWGGTWSAEFHDYSVETIEGQSYPFTQPYYWAFWLDNKPSTVGVCQAQLSPGDTVLFFPECFSETAGVCPLAPNPLAVEAPSTAEEGEAVPLHVKSYPNSGGEPTAAAGATVQEPQEHISTSTDSAGSVSLTFATTGTHTVLVSAPGSVRTEATICVHRGNDGNCGTTAPTAGAPSGAPAPVAARPYTGPYAIVAEITDPLDGHTYSRRAAPRLLTGSVLAHTGVTAVGLELRRSYRGRCWAYDGATTRFQRARCGRGTFFSIGSTSSFSYLLPSALAPGRYVLDVQAADSAGNRTTLARGSSRVVFDVR